MKTTTIDSSKSEQLLRIQFLKDIAVSSQKFNTTNDYGFDGEVGVRYFFNDGSCLKISKQCFRFREPQKIMEYVDSRGILEISVKRLSEKHILTIIRSIVKSFPRPIGFHPVSINHQQFIN